MTNVTTVFDEINLFSEQLGISMRQFGKTMSDAAQKWQAERDRRIYRDALVRIAKTIPCSRGVSPYEIKWHPDIRLRCTQCGNYNVEISHIFGLWCTFCCWYRNNQSGMLRGQRR